MGGPKIPAWAGLGRLKKIRPGGPAGLGRPGGTLTSTLDMCLLMETRSDSIMKANLMVMIIGNCGIVSSLAC